MQCLTAAGSIFYPLRVQRDRVGPQRPPYSMPFAVSRMKLQ